MSDPSAISFDLELARTLTRKLALGAAPAPLGWPRPRESTASAGESGSSRGLRRTTGRRTSSDRRGLFAAPLEIKSWEVFLAWSLELTRARAGFVVDSQGFVIATRGNLPAGSFDGLGAELCYAMEQLGRVDPEAGALRALELQFEGRRLIGLRADETKVGFVVVGLLGSKPVGDELREAIVRQLRQSAGELS
ncbi:MAG: hypothetical protein K8H90_06380 [Thermoanaerobaculia bacterium]|nr:hypothetical protein [Thermoanaerobaculia bacterium]